MRENDVEITWDVNRFRRLMGMPEIKVKKTTCRRRFLDNKKTNATKCEREFKAQFIRDIQMQHFCPQCQTFMGTQIDI